MTESLDAEVGALREMVGILREAGATRAKVETPSGLTFTVAFDVSPSEEIDEKSLQEMLIESINEPTADPLPIAKAIERKTEDDLYRSSG